MGRPPPRPPPRRRRRQRQSRSSLRAGSSHATCLTHSKPMLSLWVKKLSVSLTWRRTSLSTSKRRSTTNTARLGTPSSEPSSALTSLTRSASSTSTSARKLFSSSRLDKKKQQHHPERPKKVDKIKHKNNYNNVINISRNNFTNRNRIQPRKKKKNLFRNIKKKMST